VVVVETALILLAVCREKLSAFQGVLCGPAIGFPSALRTEYYSAPPRRNSNMSSDKDDLAADLLFGVIGPRGIAAFLGLPSPKVYYLIAQGKIPVVKMGHRTIIASKTRLRKLFTGAMAHTRED
jgi:hypothetical protein